AQDVGVALGPADQVIAGVGARVHAVCGGDDPGDRLRLDLGDAAVGQVIEVGIGVPAPDVAQLVGEHHDRVRVVHVRPYTDSAGARVGVAVRAGGGAGQGVTAGRDEVGQAVPQRLIAGTGEPVGQPGQRLSVGLVDVEDV